MADEENFDDVGSDEQEQPAQGGPHLAQRQHDDEGARYPQVSVGYEQQDVQSLLQVDLNSLDKRFKYRWVNVAPIKVSRARQKGYEFVDPSDKSLRNIVGDALDTSEDGRVRVMDVVLMRVPKGRYAANREKVKDRTKTRLGAPKRRFKKEAQAQTRSRYGVATEVITDKEPKGSKE